MSAAEGLGEVDLGRLREVAEAATQGPWEAGEACVWAKTESPSHIYVIVSDGQAGDGGASCEENAEHIATFDPPTVLALLDRLEAAERKVARVEAILTAWDAWDGSPGPDGQMHPDSSSPRDRERLRAALTEEATCSE